jgi:ABC-type transporter Mla MlaB component
MSFIFPHGLLRRQQKGGLRLAGPEEPPTPPVRAVGPPLEPSTNVLVISGQIDPGDVALLCERVRVLLKSCDADHVICDVGGLDDPDAGTVDALARLQLTARRLGSRIRLRNACGKLQNLLALMGLGDVVPCGGSPFESRGQAEQREQGLGIEEEGDPADPPA